MIGEFLKRLNQMTGLAGACARAAVATALVAALFAVLHLAHWLAIAAFAFFGLDKEVGNIFAAVLAVFAVTVLADLIVWRS